jgi:uncharacterized protein YjiS (DUF1127 family)
MATIDLFEANRSERPVRFGLLTPLLEAWQGYVRQVEEHRTIVRLSRLDPHIIRDMGFDPADLHAALEGTWDENPRRSFPRV